MASTSNSVTKLKRKSYTREFKLVVVKFYKENNLYRTSKNYSLNTKTILRWVKDVKKIKAAKKGSKHIQHFRKAAHPEVEERLYKEFRELRKKG
jgi:transposase-like protein